MKKSAIGTAAAVVLVCVVGFLYRSGAVQFNRPDLARYPIRGIDVSHHQGQIDWLQVAGSGIEFAYIKATEGRDFVDREFRTNWRAAEAAGIARGAYHFFAFCSPGRDQAEHFLAVAPPAPGALAPVADVEFVGNCSSWRALAVVRAELRVFLQRVEQAWGVAPILYVTADAYERVLAGEFTGYSVWIRDVFTEPSTSSYGGWLVWQYSETGSVPGISSAVDLNALRPGAAVGELATPGTPEHQLR